jgi:hypothetical protein
MNEAHDLATKSGVRQVVSRAFEIGLSGEG